IAAGAASWAMLRGYATSTSSHGATRFAVAMPKDQQLTGVSRLDLSPDGRTLVYTANEMLYLRRLDQIEASPLAGTAGGSDTPVFSPDGQWITYLSPTGGGNGSGALKKISVTGGNATKICDVTNLTGLRWVADRLIFSASAAAPNIASRTVSSSTLPTGI